MFTEQRSPFIIPIGEIDFFYSLVLLFCAALLLAVLFLFQKAAINNTIISKEFVILCCEINGGGKLVQCGLNLCKMYLKCCRIIIFCSFS